MKSTPKLRSTIVKPEVLDDFLIEKQNSGHVIYQVLPCPKSADYSQHDHAKTQIGSVVIEMEFVVLYFEQVKTE